MKITTPLICHLCKKEITNATDEEKAFLEEYGTVIFLPIHDDCSNKDKV